MNKQFHYSWSWKLASSPEKIWPYISDTDRFNYDVGLGKLIFNRPADSGRGRHLKMRLYNLVNIEWQEEPFQWVRERQFGVVRRYLSGPVKWMRVQVELVPMPMGGTVLTYSVVAAPQNLLGYAAIPLQIGVLSARTFEKTMRRYDALVQQEQTLNNAATNGRLSSSVDARIASIRVRLLDVGQPAALVERLISFVAQADEYLLAEIRPFQLADEWGASRRAMLELCLHAVRAGLLDFEWQVLCPHCRNAGDNVHDHLNDLSAEAYCSSCQIDFKANFQQSVEITFKPNAAIREVMRVAFCVGGPQTTPHIQAQLRLLPEQSSVIDLALSNGRYRLRADALEGNYLFVVDDQAADEETAVVAGEAGWPTETTRVGNRLALTLQNDTGQEQLIMLEQMAWSDQAVTAAEVTMLQTFRDLFASEALRPGEQFAVGSVTILFTDLVDSTRLYNDIGDAPAFGLVLNHFDVLREVIDAENGAIIKTIGDAVMAIFRQPAAAIRALAKAQAILANPPDGQYPLFLKGALNVGPSISVNLNGRLDYFGSTVNMAARLEKFSGANKIVVSEQVFADPEVRQLLAASNFTVEPFESELKGFDNGRFRLWRIQTRPDEPLGDNWLIPSNAIHK